jgi:hypothetical protein
MWESPKPPSDLDVVYTRNSRRNGYWSWFRTNGGYWQCDPAIGHCLLFSELLDLWGPAYARWEDVPIRSGVIEKE